MSDDLVELHEMIREKRRLETAALAADNAVLRQSLAIWERYKVYLAAGPMPGKEWKDPETIAEAVFATLDGVPLNATALQRAIVARFPQVRMTRDGLDNALCRLSEAGQIQKLKMVTDSRSKYAYKKASGISPT